MCVHGQRCNAFRCAWSGPRHLALLAADLQLLHSMGAGAGAALALQARRPRNCCSRCAGGANFLSGVLWTVVDGGYGGGPSWHTIVDKSIQEHASRR